MNLKAEIEIMALHEKFDELRNQDLKELILLSPKAAAPELACWPLRRVALPASAFSNEFPAFRPETQPMLELRPICENCARTLPPDAVDATTLFLRMHLLRGLRARYIAQCLPELRRRL